MTPENTLIVNVDTHLKNFYSSLNHASFFFSKYWMDTFSLFLAKVALADDPLKSAREQVFLMQDRLVTAEDAELVYPRPSSCGNDSPFIHVSKVKQKMILGSRKSFQFKNSSPLKHSSVKISGLGSDKEVQIFSGQ